MSNWVPVEVDLAEDAVGEGQVLKQTGSLDGASKQSRGSGETEYEEGQTICTFTKPERNVLFLPSPSHGGRGCIKVRLASCTILEGTT